MPSHRLRTIGVVTIAVLTAPLAALLVFQLFLGSPWSADSRRLAPQVVPKWRALHGPVVGEEIPSHVSIVVFGDYRCPVCREAWFDLRLLSRQRADVELQWRHYPIMGPASLAPASAAECARDASRWQAMHERILEGVDAFESISSWIRLAYEVGVADTAMYRHCLSNESRMDVVRADLAAGRRLGLTLTPGILVDSLLFEGYPGLSRLEEHIGPERDRPNE